MSADKSPYHITKAALMDGEIKLLSDAPSDFRVLTQNALVGADIDSSEYFQLQTKLQEVLAVQAFNQHENTCRKIVRYGETQVRVVRACWFKVSASLIQLKRAYAYTLAIKYGQGKANKFENLMQQEIEKINDYKRYQDENDSNLIIDNGSSSSGLSDESKEREVQVANSKRRDLSRSNAESTVRATKNRIIAASKGRTN